MPVTRIVIAEPFALIRAAFKSLLTGESIEVVGEVAEGDRVLDCILANSPDVLLVDIAIWKLADRFQSLAQCAAQAPLVKIIVLDSSGFGSAPDELFRLGVAAYLPLTSPASELYQAIQSVLRGETFNASAHEPEKPQTFLLLRKLSSRQQEVLTLMAKGCNVKTIAQLLGISVKTVESHRSNIMKNLEIYDVPGLVRFAIKTGLVSLND